MRLPRIVVAAPASGQGKTTVAVGLMAALAAEGRAVAPAKVGPDYIDPGYHALATGRLGRNLDPWLTDEQLVVPLLLHGARTPTPADVCVIEGVMGLFDGRIGTDGEASTAHIARLTASPVVLVVDISHAARTVAATVHGMRTYDASVRLAGVILNKAGSDRHATEVRRSIEALGVPVLGVLPRDAGVSAPSRHLGLVPAAERDDARHALDRLAEQTAELVDLAAVLEIARSAPDLDAEPWSPPVRAAGAGRVVAVAGGRSFTFRYTETDELLRAAGLQPVVFDPASDHALPAGTSGLYLGGGFPEVHAAELARNSALLAEVRDAVMSGMPTVAECAGLLYLCEQVEGFRFAGAVPATAAMQRRLTLRYRVARTPVDSILGPAGTTVRGHEFHRTTTDPAFGAVPAWLHDDPMGADSTAGQLSADGFALDPAGTGVATLHAAYLHTHWAGSPALATSFAEQVSAFSPAAPRGPGAEPEGRTLPVRLTATADRAPVASGLDHHGDAEIGDGLVDLAVNVRVATPPRWLAEAVTASVPALAAYPDVSEARAALAWRHGVPPECVLPTSGGAEAFTLVARGIRARRPVVVHPQFTEPESALRRAGRLPDRLILLPERGFTLDPDAVPADADLVLVGNPTNPTGVLHPRTVLERLRRAGRVLVVDEAFMDAVPGEPETMTDGDLTGLLVLRSLTKTWGVAGLRAGYVVGDPTLVEDLARQQPHWSVSTPAAAVMVATASPAAVDEAGAAALELGAWRAHLAAGLRDLGLDPVDGVAPFLLVRAGAGAREALRDKGFAVRRGDTFPGLGPEWVRIAAREPAVTDRLLGALADVLTGILTDAGAPATSARAAAAPPDPGDPHPHLRDQGARSA